MFCIPLQAADHHPFTGFSIMYSPLFVSGDKKLSIFGVEVQPGDRIFFDTGESVIFQRGLGAGGNTALFEDTLGRVVRLGLNPGDWDTRAATLRYGDALRDLNRLMNKDFVVQMSPQQPQSEYVHFVEPLEIEVLLEDYLNSDTIDRNSLQYWHLLEFFEEISRFQFIGDFAPFQVGWVPERGWVLFDFDTPIRAHSGENRSSLNEIFYQWDPIEDWTVYVPNRALQTLIKDFDVYSAYRANSCQFHFDRLIP